MEDEVIELEKEPEVDKPKKPRRRKPKFEAGFLVVIGRQKYGSLAMPLLQSGHLVLQTPRGQEYIPVHGKKFTVVTLAPQPEISSREVEFKMKKAFGITTAETERDFEVEDFKSRRDKALDGFF